MKNTILFAVIVLMIGCGEDPALHQIEDPVEQDDEGSNDPSFDDDQSEDETVVDEESTCPQGLVESHSENGVLHCDFPDSPTQDPESEPDEPEMPSPESSSPEEVPLPDPVQEPEVVDVPEPVPQPTVSPEELDNIDCDSHMFTVRSHYGEEFTVPSILHFSRSANSPQGNIGEGMQEVITIDATAHCGDMVLDRVEFHLPKVEDDDTGWMVPFWDLPSMVTYEYENELVSASYEGGANESPFLNQHGVFWVHEFDSPTTIPEGQTLSFTLSIPFGGEVIPNRIFHLRFYAQKWYGAGDQFSYPSWYDRAFHEGGVRGYNLNFTPSN